MARGFDIAPFFLPAPPDVAEAYRRHGPYLVGEAAATAAHTLTGFGIATAAGVAGAVGLASWGWLRDAALPLLVAVQAVPKVALAPLLIVWLGFGHTSKITLVALLSFFPVLVSTLAGLTSTPAELVDLARSLAASRRQTFLRIRLPAALPQLFTGLKLAITLALIGAVVAQLTTPNVGLGAVIVLATQSADTPLAFAAIALLAATGLAMFYAVVGLQRLLLPWAAPTT